MQKDIQCLLIASASSSLDSKIEYNGDYKELE